MSAKKPKPAPPVRHRILIVDDHPMARHGMAQLLQAERDLEVCGEVENAPRTLTLVKSLKPALVLTELATQFTHLSSRATFSHYESFP